jgi:hypothetical protein
VPTASRWAIFRRYARRVHILYIMDQYNFPLISSDAISLIEQTKPDKLPLLPNLHTLGWMCATDIEYATLFMHAGVTHACLVSPGWNAEGTTEIIRSICINIHHLRILDLHFWENSLTEHPDCKYALEHLPELHTFSVKDGILHPDTINALAVSPRIKNIRASYSRNTTQLHVYPSTLPSSSFQLLDQLILTTPIPPLTTFLANCSMPCISILRIDTPHGCFTTPLQVLDLLTVLLNHYGSIRRLQLDMLYTEIDLIHHTPQYAEHIGIQHLRPLLSFGRLTRFAIRHVNPLSLSNNDIMLMARSWPCIERLDLNSEPVLCLDAPQASIFVLLEFAKMCKALTHLGLFIHSPEFRTPPQVTCPFHHTVYIHLGASHISHTGVAGLFLHHLCPFGMNMEWGVSWAYEHYHILIDRFTELESTREQLKVYERRWRRVRGVYYAMQEASRRIRSKRTNIQYFPVRWYVWCTFLKVIFH